MLKRGTELISVDPILDRLLQIFRGKLGPLVQPDADFAEMEIDSLALAEISVVVEQEFHVRLSDRVLEVSTIRELAELIAELRMTSVSR